ncbi:MAG TPA: pilus assembly protein TadG-related protein [Acidimicrobiales bacterium]|nr:pilus assembly protein TadG-related protein [Acidimicrobiales bacterium]
MSRARRRDDRGYASAWTVAVAVACWALVGLVVDGGRALRERSDAFGAAAAAARAGVQEIDEVAAVQGEVRLDEGRAVAAAEALLARRGYEGEVTVDGVEVTVEVEGETDLKILAAPDVVTYRVSASARAVRGSDIS